MKTRRYSELVRLETFDERYEYLRLGGEVGYSTFGFDRYLNQAFYQSTEWKHIRNAVIVRDRGCDLGIPGREINGGLIVHHINPMAVDDILSHAAWILDPEYLICTSNNTHNAIHYGDSSKLQKEYVPRRPGDTKLW